MMEPVAVHMSFAELLEKDGYLIYTNTGYSMMPLLRPKQDIIEIKPLTERAKKYDVVLYKRKQISVAPYVLHRVLKVLPDGKYIIAGDHNTFKEYDVTDDMMVGIMTRVIRDGKSIYPTDTMYKLYVHLWCDFYYIRVAIIHTKRLILKIWNWLKRLLVSHKQFNNKKVFGRGEDADSENESD